ncbi:L-fuculokinase [Vibrio variabilis]|uniref:L-fuculokinase n=1 Tax=Vibrio variabilis TaxID=990271 RepID=A0ABQ0JHG3_9VIBR|nr:L-fuculokinase [Vibrio variabilis]
MFISSMITHKLTGKMSTDYTMAGTSMLTKLESCDWNEQALSYLGLSSSYFPSLVMAGDLIGTTIPQVNADLGLESGIPVISTGHDTQFALIGSGAEKDQAFLSSGTWEILMARSQRPSLDLQALTRGVTVELDSQVGVFNPATQWLSSAVVEWSADKFYTVEKLNGDLYSVMIDEARVAGAGAGGVRFNVDLSAVEFGEAQGSIDGLSIHTSRGQIMRAVFEGLSRTLKERFDYLNMLCPLQDGPVVVVGGHKEQALESTARKCFTTAFTYRGTSGGDCNRSRNVWLCRSWPLSQFSCCSIENEARAHSHLSRRS